MTQIGSASTDEDEESVSPLDFLDELEKGALF